MSLNIPFTRETMMLITDSVNCAGCGKCCREPTAFSGGHTALWPEELPALARLKGVALEQFRRDWIIPSSLSKDPDRRGGVDRTLEMRCDPCPFYKPGLFNCSIHSQRPMACRLYPVDIPDENRNLTVQIGCPEAFRIARQALWTIRRYGMASSEEKRAYLEAVVKAIRGRTWGSHHPCQE